VLLNNKSIKKINLAIRLASKTNISTLFSISYKSAYSISNLINNSNFSNKIKIYFSLKKINLEILGLGSAITIDKPLSSHKEIYAIKKKYIENSIHIRNNTKTSPKFLMGFSFNEDTQDSKWKNYNQGKIILPEIQSEIIDRSYCNTINLIINPDSKENDLIRKIEKLYQLCESPNKTKSSNKKNIILNSIPSGTTYRQYTSQVNQVINKINNYEIDKGVISRFNRYVIDKGFSFEELVQDVSKKNHNLFVYYFNINKNEFFGFSPEKLLERSIDTIASDAVAGTRKINSTENENENRKLSIEHGIVVDYIKNKLSKFADCENNNKPETIKLNNIEHLITRIHGTLNEKNSTLEILNSIHPTPAVCGSPYEKSMTLISELEMFDRGWFAGPVGLLNFDDEGSFFVAIRCLLKVDNDVYIYAGAGITKDSIPDSEWEETKTKIGSVLDYIKL